VATNCAAISSELLESTFFGHTKGSFTGAVSNHVGLIERAHGGTLFLDEICSMPLHLQGKLLRAIETGEYEPVGASVVRNSRFRVIAATNQDLHDLVARGEFREDLLYRLNSVEMHIPPLRERPEDIPLLIDWYLAQPVNNPLGKTISTKTHATLVTLRWPGNVRQLFRTLDSMLALSERELLEPVDIPEHVLAAIGPSDSDLKTFEQALRAFERDWIKRALDSSRGNVTRAANLLGVSRLGLYRRMKRLGMEVEG
jgi:transcriptional regulator with PAS, ATPase and Fis domain